MKLLVEPSGAAAAAAGISAANCRETTKRVGVIVSGGNIDADLLLSFYENQGCEAGGRVNLFIPVA